MTDHLISPAARDLPSPWHLTTTRPDFPVSATPTADEAIEVLDHVLLAREQIPESDAASLPRDIVEYWAFTAEWLSEAMPTLADVTTSALVTVVRGQWPDATAEFAQAMGNFWLRSLLQQRLLDALNVIHRGDELTDAQVGKLLEVTRRRLHTANPTDARALLSIVGAAAGARGTGLLREVRDDPRFPESVRAVAGASVHR